MLWEEYELKNRYMHMDYIVESDNVEIQSIIPEIPKVQNDTLECTLEQMTIMKMISTNPLITQNELVLVTGKSISTVKRIMKSLQEKGYIRRVYGKRYGKWEMLVRV